MSKFWAQAVEEALRKNRDGPVEKETPKRERKGASGRKEAQPLFWQILQKFVIFEFFSLNFAQRLMKFYRNFADILENVEIFRNF